MKFERPNEPKTAIVMRIHESQRAMERAANAVGITKNNLGVALENQSQRAPRGAYIDSLQEGSAPGLGPRRRRFKSCRSDHFPSIDPLCVAGRPRKNLNLTRSEANFQT
jgi:hypothetical protein